MCTDISELEFLEGKVNNYRLIERQLIKKLFASNETLRRLAQDPSLINDTNLFIDSDVTMLGLDTLGNRKSTPTVDGLEVSKDNGILLIEAKDITKALLERLNAISNGEKDLHVEGIVDNRLREVQKKLNGSINLLNRILRAKPGTIPDDTNICVGLFIDYKLTDVDEFGLTGDIGLLRDEIDEYSETITETVIFTNRRLRELEELIRKYQPEVEE